MLKWDWLKSTTAQNNDLCGSEAEPGWHGCLNANADSDITDVLSNISADICFLKNNLILIPKMSLLNPYKRIVIEAWYFTVLKHKQN